MATLKITNFVCVSESSIPTLLIKGSLPDLSSPNQFCIDQNISNRLPVRRLRVFADTATTSTSNADRFYRPSLNRRTRYIVLAGLSVCFPLISIISSLDQRCLFFISSYHAFFLRSQLQKLIFSLYCSLVFLTFTVLALTRFHFSFSCYGFSACLNYLHGCFRLFISIKLISDRSSKSSLFPISKFWSYGFFHEYFFSSRFVLICFFRIIFFVVIFVLNFSCFAVLF